VLDNSFDAVTFTLNLTGAAWCWSERLKFFPTRLEIREKILTDLSPYLVECSS